MSKRHLSFGFGAPASAHALQEAIVASFALEREPAMQRLRDFREKDWHGILEWLDVSGMALYFLDRLRQLGAESVLPSAVEKALADRLRRNRERMHALQQEALTLAGWFNATGVSFALLKGMTLVPDSVPDITLRSQVDLDFLVDKQGRDLAVQFAQRLGYHLHAESGGSLEFRAPGEDPPGPASTYSARATRALELHFVPDAGAETELLSRRVKRSIDGIQICALAPPDMLVQQARHLLKHLCGEYTRLSWVLEFRRHVLTRQGDVQFWHDAGQIARKEENGDLSMAMALWIASDLFGDLPMALPEQWHTHALPPRVQLWLARYARQVLLGRARPTKLYALLRNEVPFAAESRRSLRAILFPHYLPVRVLDPQPHEGLRELVNRWSLEMRFFLSRLWFHVLEGFRFGVEALRWRRAVARAGQ